MDSRAPNEVERDARHSQQALAAQAEIILVRQRGARAVRDPARHELGVGARDNARFVQHGAERDCEFATLPNRASVEQDARRKENRPAE